MAQDYRLASLGSSDSGQAPPFWARSKSHGPRLGRSNPGSALSARGSGRGSGHGSVLPISFPLLLGLGSSTTSLSPWPIPRLTARAFLPRLGCVGPRLGACLRPWLYATNFLPFAPRTRVKHFLFELVANPTAHGSRFGARLRPWLYAACSPLRQTACVLPCYPRGKLKCGLSYAIFRFSKVAIFSAKYRTITPFFAS